MDTPQTAAPNRLQQAFVHLREELQREVIGQPHLIDCLLIALLADGHLLVEGAPGLAKTTAVKALAARIEADFHRVQFTPDLLPADLTGRSEEHTSELQSHVNLVCRLLLEKK